jgi:hypothetical protein
VLFVIDGAKTLASTFQSVNMQDWNGMRGNVVQFNSKIAYVTNGGILG